MLHIHTISIGCCHIHIAQTPFGLGDEAKTSTARLYLTPLPCHSLDSCLKSCLKHCAVSQLATTPPPYSASIDMARDQRKSDARGIGTRPEGIRKHRPQRATRRSARLEGIQLLQKQPGSPNQRAPRHPFPSPSTSNTRTKEVLYHPPTLFHKAKDPIEFAGRTKGYAFVSK